MNHTNLRGLPCVEYHRVSGNGQLREHGGTGLDRQAESTQRFIELVGLVPSHKPSEEAYTGTEADRPKFQEMIEWCRNNNVRDIVVEFLDRFARGLLVQLRLLSLLAKKELRLWSAVLGEDCVEAMDDDDRRAFIQMMGVFGEENWFGSYSSLSRDFSRKEPYND